MICFDMFVVAYHRRFFLPFHYFLQLFYLLLTSLRLPTSPLSFFHNGPLNTSHLLIVIAGHLLSHSNPCPPWSSLVTALHRHLENIYRGLHGPDEPFSPLLDPDLDAWNIQYANEIFASTHCFGKNTSDNSHAFVIHVTFGFELPPTHTFTLTPDLPPSHMTRFSIVLGRARTAKGSRYATFFWSYFRPPSLGHP